MMLMVVVENKSNFFGLFFPSPPFSSSSLKARDGLPWSSATIFDEDEPMEPPPGGDLGRVRLSRCYGFDKEAKSQSESCENLYAQYVGLAVHPKCEFIFSNHHAGQGSIALGSSWRRKCDVMVSVEEDEIEMLPPTQEEDFEHAPGQWRRGRLLPARPARPNRRRFLKFSNFDGLFFHPPGTCLPDCPKRIGKEMAAAAAAAAAAAEEVAADQERFCNETAGPGDGSAAADAAAAAAAVTAAREGEGEDDGEDLSRLPYGKTLVKAFRNKMKRRASEAERLRQQQQQQEEEEEEDRRRLRRQSSDDMEPPAREEEVEEVEEEENVHPGVPTGLAKDRDDQEQLKIDYCNEMTSVLPDELVLTYHSVHECTLMHGPRLPDPSQWNNFTSGGGERTAGQDAWKNYSCLRTYLLTEHPKDSCVGTRLQSFTQKGFLKKVREAEYTSKGGELGGFVCIQGGRETETADGVIPRSFGFCHQRTALKESQISNFLKMQARMYHGGDEAAAWKTLQRLARQPRTIVKTSFNEDHCETLSFDYFKFLLEERKLDFFRVRHYVHYRSKKYLDKYFTDMMQLRHDIKDDPQKKLTSLSLKLIVNGFFGFCSLEACKFDRTRVVGETTLSKIKNTKRSMFHENVSDVVLLGAVCRPAKKPDLLYAISSKQPTKETYNVTQVSAAILGHSRCRFLGFVLSILRHFSASMCELAYTDTDSIVLSLGSRLLEDCIRPEFRDRWNEIAAHLFENCSDFKEQAGLLKASVQAKTTPGLPKLTPFFI